MLIEQCKFSFLDLWDIIKNNLTLKAGIIRHMTHVPTCHSALFSLSKAGQKTGKDVSSRWVMWLLSIFSFTKSPLGPPQIVNNYARINFTAETAATISR